MAVGVTYTSRESALAQAIVDEMIARGVGLGGGAGGTGGGDASAANQLTEIDKLANIGEKSDVVSDINGLYTTYPDVGDPILATPYGVISLLKGIFEKAHQFANGILTTKERNNDIIIDQSGTIVTAYSSQNIFPDFASSINYLIIQNLAITNVPSGDLWVNFGAGIEVEAVAGPGSIQIKSGETLELSRGSLLGAPIHLLGSTVGQAYTEKIGVS